MSRTLPLTISILCALCAGGCSSAPALDDRDDSFTGPKADGFCVEPGSPEALGACESAIAF